MSANLSAVGPQCEEDVRVVGSSLRLLGGPGAALGLPVLVPLDDFGEEARLLSCLDEAVPEEVLGRRSLEGEKAVSSISPQLLRCRGGGGGDCEGEPTLIGSRWRQRATNSWNVLLNWVPSVGGSFLGMRKRTCPFPKGSARVSRCLSRRR